MAIVSVTFACHQAWFVSMMCAHGVKAIDNVFPRVLSIFPGAKSAGYKLSVVVPKTSREFFSTWEHFLLLLKAPRT